MSGRRVIRVAELLQQTISQIFLRLKEPLPGLVTINAVKLSADFSYADVYYSAVQLSVTELELDKKVQELTPGVRREVARILNMRRTPEIRFHYDHTTEKATRIFSILKQLEQEKINNEISRQKNSNQNKKDNQRK